MNMFSVSMGGTAALFMGASLLSFVEILYYFIPRAMWDTYLSRKIIVNKPAQNKNNALPFIK